MVDTNGDSQETNRGGQVVTVLNTTIDLIGNISGLSSYGRILSYTFDLAGEYYKITPLKGRVIP